MPPAFRWAPVLADAGYGNSSEFRAGVTALGLRYVMGVQSNMLLWNADAVLPKRAGTVTPRLRAAQVSARELALSQPTEAWQNVT